MTDHAAVSPTVPQFSTTRGQTETLTYHDRVLTYDPCHATIESLWRMLRDARHKGGSVAFFYEPNDATRYALRIMLLEAQLVVMLHKEGLFADDLAGVIVLDTSAACVSAADTAPLSSGNAWTATVLAWFLAHVLSQDADT